MQAVVTPLMRGARFAVDGRRCHIKRFARSGKMHGVRTGAFPPLDHLAKKPFCVLSNAGRLVTIKKAMAVKFYKDPVALPRNAHVCRGPAFETLCVEGLITR